MNILLFLIALFWLPSAAIAQCDGNKCWNYGGIGKPPMTTASVFAGDLSAAFSSARVGAINGTSVPSSPSANQILPALNGTSSSWVSAATWLARVRPPANAAVYFGSAYPRGDVVRSESNGCAAAAGNGSTDDTSAIQCQLNYLHNTGVHGQAGGILYFPCGHYIINSGLTVYPQTNFVGENAACVNIDTNSADITAITVPSSADGGDNIVFQDITVSGSSSSSATNNLVVIGHNALVNMLRVQLNGGKYALENHGTDGVLVDVFACGSANAGGCVEEFGGNWYFHLKADSGTNTGTAFNVPAGGSSHEIGCTECDFSGPFTNAIAVDDGGSSPRALLNITGSVIGAPISITNASWVGIANSEIGTTSVSSASPITIVGSKGTGGNFNVSGSGTQSCAGNIDISCASGYVLTQSTPKNPIGTTNTSGVMAGVRGTITPAEHRPKYSKTRGTGNLFDVYRAGHARVPKQGRSHANLR
jgi:hypothetical protein